MVLLDILKVLARIPRMNPGSPEMPPPSKP
jgi:hypothetical protein